MRSRLSFGSLASWTTIAVALAGCRPPDAPLPRAPIPPVATGKVRVRVFTEPSPVRIIASAGSFVFVGTEHDLERWDDKGGMIPLSSEHGLAGRQIVALAPDADRRLVWVLTDASLGHYDAAAEVYREQIAPPSSMAIDFATIAKDGASMASAQDGGAWIGTAAGLLYVSAQGGWASTGIKEPIEALARDRAGWLWVATTTGLVARKPTGETLRLTSAQGMTIAAPRILVELPGERMLVIGTDDAGHERLAIGKQTAWTTYRALPDVKWSAAARRGNGAVVMGGDRVYRLMPASTETVRPLARDGMRLVPVAGGIVDWVIDPLDVVTPPGATSIGAAGVANDQLLIGTRDLGTARYRDGDVKPSAWLRRREMFRDAQTLSVACARAQDCWIATGARSAWRWNGARFVAAGPDQIVLAVVREPDTGAVYALHRLPNEKAIKLSRIEDKTWTPVPKVAITTAGDASEVGFARFSEEGSLWIGLRYRDGEERRSYGIAIVETATGRVTYHRTETADTPVDKARKPKMLPVPLGVVDGDVRGDTAWFATTEGIARLSRNGDVKLWTEADALPSEIARAVTIAPNGHVIVATGAGAARWDGKAWDFPAALRFDMNDVAATRNGQVWMATERGIAAWDGQKVRRVDVRRGLAENHILDVAVDQFDRVWARGPGSLTLISQ